MRGPAFDHSKGLIPDRDATCATLQVFEYLQIHGHDISHLEELARLVFEGDIFQLRENQLLTK